MARTKQGPDLLDAYLKRKALTHSEFAERIGADRIRVYRYLNRKRRPDLDSAFAIERETRGAVPASSWTEPGKAA